MAGPGRAEKKAEVRRQELFESDVAESEERRLDVYRGMVSRPVFDELSDKSSASPVRGSVASRRSGT